MRRVTGGHVRQRARKRALKEALQRARKEKADILKEVRQSVSSDAPQRKVFNYCRLRLGENNGQSYCFVDWNVIFFLTIFDHRCRLGRNQKQL